MHTTPANSANRSCPSPKNLCSMLGMLTVHNISVTILNVVLVGALLLTRQATDSSKAYVDGYNDKRLGKWSADKAGSTLDIPNLAATAAGTVVPAIFMSVMATMSYLYGRTHNSLYRVMSTIALLAMTFVTSCNYGYAHFFPTATGHSYKMGYDAAPSLPHNTSHPNLLHPTSGLDLTFRILGELVAVGALLLVIAYALYAKSSAVTSGHNSAAPPVDQHSMELALV